MEEGGCLSIAGGWAGHRQVEAVRVLRVRGHPRWRKESKGAVPVGAWRECAQLCQHGKSEAGVGRNSSSKRFKKNSLANVRECLKLEMLVAMEQEVLRGRPCLWFLLQGQRLCAEICHGDKQIRFSLTFMRVFFLR